MKVIAIGSVVPTSTSEQRQQIMSKEVTATLKLYLDSKIEQFWYRQDKPGVIFLMNVKSVEEAEMAVDALPLVAAGAVTFEVMAVGPLMPLGMLLSGK